MHSSEQLSERLVVQSYFQAERPSHQPRSRSNQQADQRELPIDIEQIDKGGGNADRHDQQMEQVAADSPAGLLNIPGDP
ncbi:hypothetical protein D3C76_585730 [compost metagenome]